MSVSFDFDGTVALVTGASGALGSAICRAFGDSGATVCGTARTPPTADDSLLDPGEAAFYAADLTNEEEVERVVQEVVNDHGRLDYLLNVAGTWKGGDPIHETDVETFELLFDVNLKTMFLASKHALPHLQESDGAIVSVSAKSSLEGGEGDGPYRASKAGVRLLTETIAEENVGSVQANAVLPSIIDTPANREMLPDADHESWPDPADIAELMCLLCSDAATVTSGASVPVYGDAR